MILPFSAGGGTDVVGRIVAKGLSDRLGQQVVVDNRAGGGSTIGTAAVAKSPADGYTLLFASAAYSYSPTVYKSLPYAPDDLVAVAIVNTTPLMVTINPNVKARDLEVLHRAAEGQSRQVQLRLLGHAAPRCTSAPSTSTRRPASTSCTCRTRARRRR